MDDPARIVSLVPSHTESLHDLGFASKVVGRTKFCIAPSPWVDEIPSVGGTKDASFAKIMALQPDLVVADKDENPLALIEQLQNAGVNVLWSDIETIEQTGLWLCELANRCGNPAAGEAAAAELADAVRVIAWKQELPVFCPIWHNPWMTFNGTAYPSAMLAAVGLRNVFAGRSGAKYFEVEPKEVASSEALTTLLPTEPFPFHKQLNKIDASRLGVSGEEGRVHVIDGEALTWFGTRTARGLKELAKFRQRLI